MNRLANLALSMGETLVHEAGRLLFGFALGRAKELLGTPQPLGIRQLALNRALQKKAVDGALLAGPRTGKEYAKFTLKKGLPTDQRPRTLAVENRASFRRRFQRSHQGRLRKGRKEAYLLRHGRHQGWWKPPAWEDQCSRTRCREGRLPL